MDDKTNGKRMDYIYKKNKARTQTTEWANGTSSINNKYIKNDNTIL